jgi:hypothetical protein
MSDTQKPKYTRTNVQRFVTLLGADDNISRHAYALLESAGEISYDEMATYRAEAYATSVELQNAKKHLELAENALQREQGQVAVLTAENDFLKEKVCDLGGVIEGFEPKPTVTHTCDLPILRGTYTYAWTVKPLPKEPKPAIGPGDGYRLLEDGELIEQGDGFCDASIGPDWEPARHGLTVAHMRYLAGFNAPNIAYRRKIEPAAETPKNPFASYVAPKKEQKYWELGEGDVFQRGDFWTYKSRFNDEAGRWEMTEQDATRYWAIPDVWHGQPVQYRHDQGYIRPITEKEGK